MAVLQYGANILQKRFNPMSRWHAINATDRHRQQTELPCQ